MFNIHSIHPEEKQEVLAQSRNIDFMYKAHNPKLPIPQTWNSPIPQPIKNKSIKHMN